ncbi:uncharacterized protein LOC110713612 [Chenopodium quinoa]|uniref:uncharacterized protein LOC110713612 n=1 Tax=Chenopodium quinoa TaxID=63459 RepID=UPI000B772C9F|nr:uncharacterized protein LOC110713612 [Chenopodium quinoa]
MITIPNEKESVRIFIRNLQDKYQKHLKYQLLNTFKAVYNIGIKIEDDLMKSAAANSNNAKGNKNDHPSSFSPINEVLAKDTSKQRIQRSKRMFTPLGMSYETAFDKLHHNRLVMPIGPIKDPVPEARPPKWLDVKNAFLHGNLNETVYMYQPLGFKDPSRPDHSFADFVASIGFAHSKSDNSLFIYHHGNATAYILLHVDDIVLTASSESLCRHVISQLSSEFAMKY